MAGRVVMSLVLHAGEARVQRLADELYVVILSSSISPRSLSFLMALEDFERELAASKASESRRKRDRSRSRERHHKVYIQCSHSFQD